MALSIVDRRGEGPPRASARKATESNGMLLLEAGGGGACFMTVSLFFPLFATPSSALLPRLSRARLAPYTPGRRRPLSSRLPSLSAASSPSPRILSRKGSLFSLPQPAPARASPPLSNAHTRTTTTPSLLKSHAHSHTTSSVQPKGRRGRRRTGKARKNDPRPREKGRVRRGGAFLSRIRIGKGNPKSERANERDGPERGARRGHLLTSSSSSSCPLPLLLSLSSPRATPLGVNVHPVKMG